MGGTRGNQEHRVTGTSGESSQHGREDRGLRVPGGQEIHLIRCSLPIPSTVNVYFLREPVPTLIDVPAEGEQYLEELERGLSALGSSVRNVRRIIVTHPHFDHYGLSRILHEEYGAEVWVARHGAHWIEEYGSSLRDEEAYRAALLAKAGAGRADIARVTDYYREANCFASGATISRYLAEGDEIELGTATFTVVAAPGHTPFCVLLKAKSASFAFTGDFIPPDITTMPLVQWTDIHDPSYRTTGTYVASLEKVREMDLQVALPGHGRPIREASKRIERLLGIIGERARAVQGAVAGGLETPVEIARHIFPHLRVEMLFREVSDVMGHLEMLEEQGIVERTGREVVRFRAVDRADHHGG